MHKYQTTINDNAFIGSNVTLIAPVEIGKDAYIAAGSTITTNTPENKLIIARCKQTSVDDWVRPDQREDKERGNCG